MIKIIMNGCGTVATEIDSTNVKDAETMKKHIEEAAMLREHAQLAMRSTPKQYSDLEMQLVQATSRIQELETQMLELLVAYRSQKHRCLS